MIKLAVECNRKQEKDEVHIPFHYCNYVAMRPSLYTIKFTVFGAQHETYYH
jgi:hypothetical protein